MESVREYASNKSADKTSLFPEKFGIVTSVVVRFN